MRVVAGEFGGRKLVAPDGQTTRPTTDKVREAVFNSLGAMGLVEDAVVLDLYAGSGALGIEALSRGAERCTFVERDRNALRALAVNLDALKLHDRSNVITSDVLAWVPAVRNVDLALIDPPYSFDDWPRLLGLLHAAYALCESAREVEPPPGWETVRARRYGRATTTLLARSDA
ncbi:MAG: putative ribosomal methyltransferase [Ilumatobacteraceae bacterium]|nr:putative ribosomal methyltransferase [Ilumatobacteraceae bacterium]